MKIRLRIKKKLMNKIYKEKHSFLNYDVQKNKKRKKCKEKKKIYIFKNI